MQRMCLWVHRISVWLMTVVVLVGFVERAAMQYWGLEAGSPPQRWGRWVGSGCYNKYHRLRCVLSRFSQVWLCDSMDCSPSGSSVHGSLQARIRGCHALLQGNLPDPGIKPASLMSPPLAGRFFTTSAVWEARLESQGLNNRHFSLRVLEARSPMSEF